jgi:hypothetical protein
MPAKRKWIPVSFSLKIIENAGTTDFVPEQMFNRKKANASLTHKIEVTTGLGSVMILRTKANRN